MYGELDEEEVAAQEHKEEREPLFTTALTFENVLEEERRYIDSRVSQRLGGTTSTPYRQPFSVAFSGGGMRAAAVQAGVLWRLAEEGRLKDVEYLVAVSGGAYIGSAWASHLLEQGGPDPDDKDIDKWYRKTVAKTIVRMQRNAGNFVRDPFSSLEGGGEKLLEAPRDGSSVLPRVFDLPMLLAALMLALVINWVEIIVVYLVPLQEVVAFAFGPALRAAYCAPPGVSHLQVLWQFSTLPFMTDLFCLCFMLSFVFWVLKKLPSIRRRKDRFLFMRSCHGFLKRFTVGVAVAIAMLAVLPALQVWTFGADKATTTSHCVQYVQLHKSKAHTSDLMTWDLGCSDWIQGAMWYDHDISAETRQMNPAFGKTAEAALGHDSAKKGLPKNVTAPLAVPVLSSPALRTHRSIMTAGTNFLLSTLFAGIILAPFSVRILNFWVGIVGPFLLVILTLSVLQHRVYAPLTGQAFAVTWMPSSKTAWIRCTYASFAIGLILLPFYGQFRRFWHEYYARCLRQNFFAGGRFGEDYCMTSLLDNPYCPFLLLTGTANDFKRMDETQQITEIFFSALHTGSNATGYVETPEYRKLATCMALSGGGAIDCVALSLADRLVYRFWLELANLSWGDYITFRTGLPRHVRLYTGITGTKVSQDVVHGVFELPNMLVFAVWQVLLTLGWLLAMHSQGAECRYATSVFFFAIFAWLLAVLLSFFGHVRCLEGFMLSPMLRQIHQVTHYSARGDQPPGLLYVTDGGVQDCTGIVQLMRRRCKRILLVLAAADPNDELSVLRVAMAMAVRERLGCFYDPADSRRDVRMLLDRFQQNKEEPFLHIGIRYGWLGGNKEHAATADEEELHGSLYIIKNRLPPHLENEKVKPLISEAEVCAMDAPASSARGSIDSSNDKTFNKEIFKEPTQEGELGGFGCCDCCHRRGCNCGTKFPHLTGANYLWLTPTLFSSLCRLGHELAGPVLETAGLFQDSTSEPV